MERNRHNIRFFDKMIRFCEEHTSDIIMVLTIISILPLMLISIYSRQSADDFDHSMETYRLIQSGDWNILSLLKKALESDIYFYHKWQGLYSSSFIMSLQPGIFGEKYYFVGTMLLIILAYICLYLLLHAIKTVFFPFMKRSSLISLVILSILLNGLPSAAQGLYWFNGAWNYMPFFFFICFEISLMLVQYQNKRCNVRIFLLCEMILSFIISGGNHVTSFLNIMLLTMINILFYKRIGSKNVFPLISAVIGFMIMYVAPGTSIRQSYFTSPGVLCTIIFSIKHFYSLFCGWINIQWVCYTLLVVIFALFLSRNTATWIKESLPHPLLVVLVSIMFICGMICVPYYAMGNPGADRVKNVIWMTFMILTAIDIIDFIIWFEWKHGLTLFDKLARSMNVRVIVLFLCTGCVFFSDANGIKAIRELKNGTAQTYARIFDTRISDMADTDRDIIYTQELPRYSMLYFNDVTTDLMNPSNRIWMEYYGYRIKIAD